MDGRWHIELLGGLRATRGDRVVTRFPTQNTRALLAYLAYYPDRTHRRDALIELLWPEVEAEKGRHSLRQTLYMLRHQVGPQSVESESWMVDGPVKTGSPSPSTINHQPLTVLVTDRASVSMISDSITTDVAAFGAALRSAKRAANDTERNPLLAQAVELYRGELPPGTSTIGCCKSTSGSASSTSLRSVNCWPTWSEPENIRPAGESPWNRSAVS